MDMLRFTILGCGSSGGVPRIGDNWGDCDPKNPKNNRQRCSLLVERLNKTGTTRILIDTSPDMRNQLLDAGVGSLDGVVYTRCMYEKGQIADWVMDFAENVFTKIIDKYDYIFKLKVLEFYFGIPISM